MEFSSLSYAMRVAIAEKISKKLKDNKNIYKMSEKEIEEYIVINQFLVEDII